MADSVSVEKYCSVGNPRQQKVLSSTKTVKINPKCVGVDYLKLVLVLSEMAVDVVLTKFSF